MCSTILRRLLAGTVLLFFGAIAQAADPVDITYGYQGMVDLRLVALLYLGSLMGIHLGAYGTKVVREVIIRLVTSCIILLCVLSRAINMPVYVRQLGYVEYDPGLDTYFNTASKTLLYASGMCGVAIILVFVFKAYWQRRKTHATLVAGTTEVQPA